MVPAAIAHLRGFTEYFTVGALGVQRVVGTRGDAAPGDVALDALALGVVAIEDLDTGVADGQQPVVCAPGVGGGVRALGLGGQVASGVPGVGETEDRQQPQK